MTSSSTRTVDRALALLIGVADHADGRSLTELARDADLSPSTASRLLGTLVGHGFVRRDESGTYRAGFRLIQVAATALRGEAVYELAGPHLLDLARDTGETANLAVRTDDDQALYLRQVASQQLVQTRSWTGRTVPIMGTAVGDALRGKVGRGGFANTRATLEPDVTAVACPVLGTTGGIVAALSVVAPTYRTSDEDVESIGRSLVRHAEALTLDLGGPVSSSLVGAIDDRRGSSVDGGHASASDGLRQ
jgi:DNA-binding IclR family transcriptional regulator